MWRHGTIGVRQRGFTLDRSARGDRCIRHHLRGHAADLRPQQSRLLRGSSQAASSSRTPAWRYEKLVSDIRLAGFDYKRAGVPTNAVPQWLPTTPYGLGVVVVPTNANGFSYRCTTPGTSGATPPSWNTGAGTTTTDGTVVWTQFGATGVSFDQPDEQIEYAWHSAITIRANYDYDATTTRPLRARPREKPGVSGSSPSSPPATTRSSLTRSSRTSRARRTPTRVTFYADVNNGELASRRAYPGGVAERLITISGVDLSNSNPPYTLNRYTLNDAGGVVTTPLARQHPQPQLLLFPGRGRAPASEGPRCHARGHYGCRGRRSIRSRQPQCVAHRPHYPRQDSSGHGLACRNECEPDREF